jgi:hypothetical protein
MQYLILLSEGTLLSAKVKTAILTQHTFHFRLLLSYSALLLALSNIHNNKIKCYPSFIHQWFYSPLLGPGLFSFVIFFTKTVGLLGRVISPSRGR